MFNSFTLPTQLGFIGLYSILIFASLFVYFKSSSMTLNTVSELKNRIKTWAIIITGLFIVLIGHKWISIIGFTAISFFAFNEYVKSIQIRQSDKGVIYFSYAVIPIQYLWIALDWYNMALVFIPVYVFLSIPLFLILSKETTGFLRSVGTIYWGMMATVFCLSHIALLFTLPSLHSSQITATSLIFFLLFLTEVNDVLQYIWGKSLGNIKIIPSISPNKTWAGFIGGVSSTTLISYLIAPYFTPFNTMESIYIGLIIGIAGFIGDVCMSAIKRDIGIKDYSSFLPGHGGVLDRLDSLIYTAPLFFHFLHYIHY